MERSKGSIAQDSEKLEEVLGEPLLQMLDQAFATLTKERKQWLATGMPAELVGRPVDLFVRGEHVVKADPACVAYWRAKDIAAWKNCLMHIRINDLPYEVEFDFAEDTGLDIDISRPSHAGERRHAECPTCLDVPEWHYDSDGLGHQRIECHGCGLSWPIVDGVPTEYREVTR